MLKQPEYWKTESTVPLMTMVKGYLDQNNLEHAFEKARGLLTKFKEPLDITPIEWPEPEMPPTHIIVKDVERTFTAPEFRNRMSRLLTLLNHEFKDYAQGMSFLVSFLSLFLDDASIVAIARRLNSDKHFIPGYWKHEAVAFVTDAYVLDHLLHLFNPHVHAHLLKNHIMPATYPQKWFVALCVHLLPFKVLFDFLERFFERGVRFLFQFGLGFFKVLGPEIMKSDNPVNIFGYLRLDYNVVEIDDTVYRQIIEAADEFNLDAIESDESLAALRKQMYDHHLGARYEAMVARNAAPPEEDEEFDFDDDFEAEPGSECQLCENMVPDYWCFGCSKFICGMCHDGQRHGHVKSADHKLVSASSAPPEAYEKPAEDEDDNVKDLEDSLAKTSV